MQEREEMILLVLKENTVLPNVKQRVDVFSLKGIIALNNAQKDNAQIFAVKQNCTKAEIQSEDDLCEFGTVCSIVDVRKNGNGVSVTLEGIKRGCLEDLSATTPCYKGGVIDSFGKPFDVEFKHNLYKGILYKDIKEMERLGMIVDVSHLSDAGFRDVLAHTTKPFVASHSNARALVPCCPRDLTDDMIRQLGERELIPAWRDLVQVCVAGEEWVDFMDSSVDKGNALRWLQERFGIRPEETMAFGDNTNDIGLMRAAYYSYAVENARPEVKAAARFSCPSWTEKGVWKAVRATAAGKE